MEERFRENYFVLLRIILLVILEVYLIFSQSVLTGASVEVLLLLALFIGVIAGKELVGRRYRMLLFGLAIFLCLLILCRVGTAFVLLGVYLFYEVLTYIKPHMFLYFLPLCVVCVPGEINGSVQLLLTILLGVIYFQNDFVVESYRRQTKEDTIMEQTLKRNLNRKEHEIQEEVRKSLLMLENQMLEERTELSQTLHDKLGHNINGSVYQLEAVKVIMEKEPETAKKMIQAVIDQLRSGMDEIRVLLRKERPKKHKLAALQLEKLCEDCRRKGIDAELLIV